jgi:hypothetical protein
MKTPQGLNGWPSPVCPKADKPTPFQSQCGNWDTTATSVRIAAEASREADKLACDAWTDRRSPRRRSVTRSMQGTSILRSAASTAIPIRPLPSTLCGARRQRRSMSWSATCDARTALRCAVMPISAAIWSRYGAPRFRRAIRRHIGGRGAVMCPPPSVQHRRQVGAVRLIVETDCHQCHLMHQPKPVLQAPAE